jgi:hypothetical protein
MLFYRDFSIYPDVVNIVQLKNIFSTLSDLLISSLENDNNINESHLTTHIKGEFTKNEKIGFNLFTDSLILSAMHSRVYSEDNEIAKIFHLLEKMCHSRGMIKFGKNQ